MQDRYAGDVGDFGKFALLRALAPGRRLGVCWYRTDGAGESSHDGHHLDYLDHPERFRGLDPEAFEALGSFVAGFKEGRLPRSVASLERLQLLPRETRYHGEFCPESLTTRTIWAGGMVESMEGADLVFLDPDNGLETATLTPKSVTTAELAALRRPDRALLLYHHQTRRPGGAAAEAANIFGRLSVAGFRSQEAVRLRPYSSRFYFLIDADSDLRRRLEDFTARWGDCAQFYRNPA